MQGFRPKIIRTGDGRFGKRASGSGVYRNPRSRRNRFPTERFAKQASFAKTSRRCSVSTVRRRRTLPAGKPRPMRRTVARRHSPVARPFGGQHTHVRRIYRMDQGNFRGDASRKTKQASFPSLLVFRLYDCTPDVVLRQNRTGRVVLARLFRLRLRRSPFRQKGFRSAARLGWPLARLRHSALRKEFFATYTPPQKTDFTFFAASEPRTLRGIR